MDGVEIPLSDFTFIRELSWQDSEEEVGIGKFPLDNRFGDKEFTTERVVERESTNELSVDTSIHLDGTLGLDILSAISADIEAHVSRETGHRIGERLTERQTHTFKVGPKKAVTCEVVWKRNVRSGERLYLSGGNRVTVPFRFNYGLSCGVRAKELV
jgi:hypothetical protein